MIIIDRKIAGTIYAKISTQYCATCVYVIPFCEDRLAELIDVIGPERVLFGSDYPHPEGLANPVGYIDDLPDGLAQSDVARIMGGNLRDLLGVAS